MPAGVGNASGSVLDMTSVRTVPSAVALVTFAGPRSAVIPAIARADPVGHQVTYTVTTTSDLMANIRYMSADPPSMAAFNADSSKYMITLHTPIAGGQPLVYTATLANPSQWAIVTASGGLRSQSGVPLRDCCRRPGGGVAGRRQRRAVLDSSLVIRLPQVRGGKGVADVGVASLVSDSEPLLPLRGRAMRPGLGVGASGRLLLDTVVAHRCRGREGVLDVLVAQRLQVRHTGALLLDGGRVVCPHPGVAVRLQLRAHATARSTLRTLLSAAEHPSRFCT